MVRSNYIEVVDCLEGLSRLPDECVQTCVTSPPYWRLRDYNVAGQIGLELTPGEYIDRIVSVFSEVRRVLRTDGTLWLNLGDTYNAYKANTGDSNFAGYARRPQQRRGLLDGSLKNKDLVGIPWRVALALQGLGYYLRQDIIWCKPNPMPESVRDRCTKAHEYLFLLAKSDRYYFDQVAIKTPLRESSKKRLCQDVEGQMGSSRVPGKTNGNMKAAGGIVGGKKAAEFSIGDESAMLKFETRNGNGKPWESTDNLCNKRSVWIVGSKPFKGNHFATFPEALIVDCIKAGSRIGDIVLDPFMGAGTTAVVAARLGRKYIGFELNQEYVAMAEKRLKDGLGMFYGGL